MVSLNSSSAKDGRTQNALQSIFILFWVQVCCTIKRAASLGGLRKIECSSIKIKYKERHKITSRTLRYSSQTFGSRKSQRDLGVPAVGNSGIWCRKFWHLTTQPSPACARSPIESPDESREFRVLKVLAPSRSPNALGLSLLARLWVRSSNVSQKSRLLEVSVFYQKFRLQLC